MNQPTKSICLLGVALLLGVNTYAANKLIVANDGVDSLTCGAPNHPCRSISQAIQNAGSGDTIIVGPGTYDESVEPGSGNNVLVSVTKPLKIFSRDGADVTVLNAGTNFFMSSVIIFSPDCVFGAKGKGFTMLAPGELADCLVVYANHVTVAGNRAVGAYYDGFATTLDTQSNQFIGNVAVGCGLNGFNLQGTNYTVEGNVAIGNKESGFAYQGTGLVFKHNVASGNRVGGFEAVGSTNALNGTITANSFIGNKLSGIFLESSFSVTKNNIFGNDPTSNCGLDNLSSTASAPKNFWGAATGPGSDPADAICDSNTVTTPFATKEIKVKVIKP